MQYVGIDVVTGKHMVYVSHVTGLTETIYFKSQKEADEAIQADFQAEREGRILR